LTLAAGTHLGAYLVIGKIGEGGMGEVYRATDTRLHRDVALKVLPDAFAREPDRLLRFTREAHTLAALNHPNIAHIYGFEEAPSTGQASAVTRALVMELVEGEDLSQRIARGAVPLDHALAIARQIADALEAAHEQGIIHRDLKPANVKVRSDGVVKVLDFGLARTLDAGPGSRDSSGDSTLTSPAMTQAGMILGTAAYMSPEQAKGRIVDKRADIWAFGVVLYEMLAGRPLFQGDSVVETIGFVATRDPDWANLPPATPAGIRRLLSRCLTRDPKHRLRDIGEARIALLESGEPATTAPAGATQPAASMRGRLTAGAVILVAAGVAGGWYLGSRDAVARTATLAPFQAEIVPTPPDAFGRQSTARIFTFTPDGRTLIYASTDPAARLLYRRDRDSSVGVPIAGTEGAYGPFVSPNGESIGFFAAGQMKRVPIGGGAAQVIRDLRVASAPDRVSMGWTAEVGPAAEIGYGAAWLEDDTIVYGPFQGGLWRVSASGGTPAAATQIAADGEIAHRLPQALPGGGVVLMTVIRDLINRQGSTIEAVELASGARTRLVDNATDGRYVPGGYLTFARNAAVYAVRFDAGALRTSGEPVKIGENVMHAIGGGRPAAASGVAQYDVAADGVLATLDGGTIAGANRQLIWALPGGRTEPFPLPPGGFLGPRISLDGSRIATRQAPDIVTIGVTDGLATPLAEDGLFPIWHPDGSRVFAAMRDRNRQNIFSVPLSGGARELVVDSANLLWPSSVSRDGRFLAYVESSATTGNDIWIVGLQPRSAPVAIVATPDNESFPAISPNGKWLAYATGDRTTSQVYVRPLSGPGLSQRISRDGGTAPVWSDDGGSIYYGRLADTVESVMRDIVRVAIDTGGPRIGVGTPAVVAAGAFNWSTPVAGFDVTRDGARILATVTAPRAPGAPSGPPTGTTLRLTMNPNLSGARRR